MSKIKFNIQTKLIMSTTNTCSSMYGQNVMLSRLLARTRNNSLFEQGVKVCNFGKYFIIPTIEIVIFVRNKILKFIVWIEISLPFSANIFLLQHLPLDHRCQSSCHLWRKFVISKFNVELTLLRRMDGQQCIIICLKTGVYLTFNKENILELSMRQVFGKMCLVNKYTTGPMLLTWKVTETWT